MDLKTENGGNGKNTVQYCTVIGRKPTRMLKKKQIKEEKKREKKKKLIK